jgi:hypothetical protein
VTAVDDGVGRLLTVLRAEERLYVEMRDLLQQERELIANLDSAGLELAVRRKEALAEEGRLLEESRVQVASALAAELGLPEARPTLSQLCDAIEGGEAELRDAHSRLTALVGAVQELLTANFSFAGDAHAQVEATLQLLGRLLPETPTYRPPGACESAARGGRLVRQSA